MMIMCGDKSLYLLNSDPMVNDLLLHGEGTWKVQNFTLAPFLVVVFKLMG
jgi:hypothetical protein